MGVIEYWNRAPQWLKFACVGSLILLWFVVMVTMHRIASKGLLSDGQSEGTIWTEVFEGKKLYVLGDSTVANGNYDMTHRPYGIDLKDGSDPSGRFSNGYTIADYLAMKLGSPIPQAHNSMTEEQRKKNVGINFASAGCGILSTTHLLPKCRTLNDQIGLLTDERPSSADLEDSLFFLSAGSNDFIADPKLNVKDMVAEFKVKIKSLYKRGARNFLINNVGPVGCIPNKRDQSTETDEFSTKPCFSTPIDKPCCGKWDAKLKMFMCNKDSVVCEARKKALFFDGAHITERANKIYVDHCFSGDICHQITTAAAN
ncbi:hypothetical protein RHGRI_022135 [Rhododendron griersonianum]|uniref:SGNH hydrolase-type esterase domain-containing protein n=1 Tax=Rhododendron griersonianum TaxID=479676 RepID=A0AAV6JR25_9ERIC|nr:hypothetical protein RHGRI_022135 [Rhododendron griersonianum]